MIGLVIGLFDGRWDDAQLDRLDALERLIVMPVFWSTFVNGMIGGVCFWRTVNAGVSAVCPEWADFMVEFVHIRTSKGESYDCTLDHLLAALLVAHYVSWLLYPSLVAVGRKAYNAIRDEHYLVGRRLQNRRSPEVPPEVQARGPEAGLGFQE